jgi:hypothetical protein
MSDQAEITTLTKDVLKGIIVKLLNHEEETKDFGQCDVA